MSDLGIDSVESVLEVHVVAGSGGVDTPADAQRLREMISAAAPVIPTRQVSIVHDTRLILAAGGLDTGISVIAGTGSVAWGRNDDAVEARSGGWGHLLGDEGSSWWVAREAVRRCLHRADLELPEDGLDRAVIAARGLRTRGELIADFHPSPDRTQWAALARVVDDCAQQGHDGASDILIRATDHLVQAACAVSSQLGLNGPVVIGGGLVGHSSTVRRAFVTRAQDRGLTDVRVLDVDPVTGTMHLAPEEN